MGVGVDVELEAVTGRGDNSQSLVHLGSLAGKLQLKRLKFVLEVLDFFFQGCWGRSRWVDLVRDFRRLLRRIQAAKAVGRILGLSQRIVFRGLPQDQAVEAVGRIRTLVRNRNISSLRLVQ